MSNTCLYCQEPILETELQVQLTNCMHIMHFTCLCIWQSYYHCCAHCGINITTIIISRNNPEFQMEKDDSESQVQIELEP